MSKTYHIAVKIVEKIRRFGRWCVFNSTDSRNLGSRVVSSEALAANVPGLTTQIPVKMIYLTDGPPSR